MAKPITVTITQLRDLLGRVTHAVPFSATVLTDAGAKKSPHGTVYKLTRINAMTGVQYSASVERQQAREGVEEPSFVAQPRKWGVRESAALVSHKGEFYLPAQLNPSLKPKPLYLIERARALSNRPTLIAVAKSVVAPWLPADRSAETAAAQNVVRPITYRDFKLSSIKTLSLNGLKYRVR